jgi:tungstate transport system ATP-binding protein
MLKKNMVNISLSNILIRKQDRLVLDIPHFNLPCHRITAIIGPNGAGKSMLLKTIAGLIKQPEFKISTSANQVSIVLTQTPFIKMSVLENLLFLRDARPSLSLNQVHHALKIFLLNHLSDQPATKLSSGEKQRLAIARAYLMGSDLLILDEPTASLDPQSTALIESKVNELAHSGICFLIASHDFAQVKRICDHIVFVKDGKIIESGSTTSFFSAPTTQAAKEFISTHL